jgi:hypothetical protein
MRAWQVAFVGVPVLVTFAWLTLAGPIADALPEHPPHADYSATIPYSPRAGAVQSTATAAILGSGTYPLAR